jgi:LuxR family maltose regulon positive regulatory protein
MLRAIDDAVPRSKAQRIRDSAAAGAVAALAKPASSSERRRRGADALIEAGVIARRRRSPKRLSSRGSRRQEAEVAADAGLREAAAIAEVQATEELAARLDAAATLTAAEKKLLRYFKTDLTFAMIADKLGASRGAVKDRASRIYKKLGVHSREEAAAAAIELGLLKA